MLVLKLIHASKRDSWDQWAKGHYTESDPYESDPVNFSIAPFHPSIMSHHYQATG